MPTSAQVENLLGALGQIPNVYEATSWIGSDIFSLAAKENGYPEALKFATTLGRHPDWTLSYYGVFRPITLLLATGYQTPVERLEYINRCLLTRAYMLDGIDQAFGTRRFQVVMGGATPMECVIGNEIHLGGTRFSLLDGQTFSGGQRVQLGMADINMLAPSIIRIGLIQDHANVERDQVLIDAGGQERKARTVVGNKQKRIREFMRKDRPMESSEGWDTPGVEELALYTALDIMRRAGVLTDKALIVIPFPHYTTWGGVQDDSTGLEGSSHQTIESIAKGLQSISPSVKRKLATILREQGYAYRYRYFRGDLKEVAKSLFEYNYSGWDTAYLTIAREEMSLSCFLANLVMAEIPDLLKPSPQALEVLGYNDNFQTFDGETVKEPGNLYRAVMHYLTSRTPRYLKTFGSYYQAFFDAGQDEFTQSGRRLSLAQIRTLPFVDRIKINPILEA